MKKIAFRHVPFTDAQRAELSELVRSGFYEPLWLSDDEPVTADTLKDCTAVMGYIPPALLAQLPDLRWLQTPAAGVDKLCAVQWANPDMVLTNCSGAFGTAIAEYMLTGLMMLMRHMPAYLENQRHQLWQCMGEARTISGSRITVIGTGDIGTAFAQKAAALGAHVTGVHRTERPLPPCFERVLPSDRLTEAVRDADAVVLALPGTPSTKGMISRQIIEAMDRRTILVNCGRGAAVDQTALTEALAEKRIAGAVLDVFCAEPLPADDPLWQLDNVIVTPHVSGRDEDPMNASMIFDIFTDNLTRYIQGRPMTHMVDRRIGY